jgi:chromosome segregation ATPase
LVFGAVLVAAAAGGGGVMDSVEQELYTANRLVAQAREINQQLSREIEVLTQERDRFGRDIETLRMQVGLLEAQAQEAEMLEQERDNALLAVEGLERELLEAEATRYSPTEW